MPSRQRNQHQVVNQRKRPDSKGCSWTSWSDTEFGTNPRWLSDDRRLLFRHQDKLYVVDSRSGKMREVLSASPNTFESLSVSRDDRLLVYAIRITEADIWLAGPER